MGNNIRQIVLDTETTGLLVEEGHRVIEIGAVELMERRITGKIFHQYINPGRKVEAGALLVHGITDDFLAGQPVFSDIADKFIDFISGAEIIIHNAQFDVKFLNNELKLLNSNANSIEYYAAVFDTLWFARKKHPGKKNSLDALCKRYGVNNSKRELHGALLDAYLLTDVYLIMTSGQRNLFEDNLLNVKNDSQQNNAKKSNGIKRNQNVIQLTTEENKAHNEMLEMIKNVSQGKVLWSEEVY